MNPVGDRETAQALSGGSLLPELPRPSHKRTIQTARLLLCPFKHDDLSVLHVLRTNPEVMGWTRQGRVDQSEQETRTWMTKFIYDTDDVQRMNYNFVVWRRNNPNDPCVDGGAIATNTLSFIGILGVISLWDSDGPEVGYLFLPEAWGKGYATEALKGFTDAWWKLPWRVSFPSNTEGSQVGRLIAVTNKTNIASANVLTKCGWMVVEETTEGVGDNQTEILRWVLNRPEL